MSDTGRKPAEMSAPADLSGRELGDFHLLRRLGRGAMAEVYLAEQQRLKRRVAVKILKPELADDETYLRRFEREAQAAASLVHANIVQIHEVGHVDGLHYIVQEYVQGQNLRDWLARHGAPNLSQTLSIMRQVAAALAKAAELGVVHRDIKPENIMLTAAGEVKVADFGLARVAHLSDATDLTQIGMTMGTPLYMSPEQVEGRALDPRSDIYSFGVTCYQMLTGKPPFAGDTALAVAVQHLKKDPPSLETLRPDLPAAVCRVVHTMLAKDPDRRWQSAHELLRELYRIRLEYCAEATAEELAAWESVGIGSLGDSRVRATQRLDGLMKSASAGAFTTWAKWLLATGVVGAAALGGGAAWLTARQTPLLAQTENDHVRIPRQPTALRQWYYASRLGTEEAWRAVIEYFPEKEYFVLRAKQQLARIYLHERNYDRALASFEELANSEQEGEFRAFGLAGKCGILTLQKKYRESAAVVDELLPIQKDLRDSQMQILLKDAIKKNQENLGPPTDKEFEDWLDGQMYPGT